MMNKKGGLVLRDMVFMMMIVSAIFILSGIFVSDIAFNYDNTNMSNEWAISGTNTLANTTFYTVVQNVSTTADGLSDEETGFWSMLGISVSRTLNGIGDSLVLVLTAPNTIGNLLSATLVDMGASPEIGNIINFLLVTILWGIIIFTIVSAFLQGGRV